MTTMPKGINWNEQFYKLLRLSLRLTQEFIVNVNAAYSGDSRSPIPMISVHSVGDLLYRRQS